MKINVERMRYKNDSVSFLLCMLGLVFNVIQFILIYANCYLQTMTGKEGFGYYTIGLDILYNIVFMLVVFYAAEELKTYHIGWTIATLIIGIFQLVRIGGFPTSILENGFYDDKLFHTIEIYYILSAVCFFIATAVSFTKSTLLKSFLKKNKITQK